jgi:enterochelin esterase-like enzyme
MRTAGVHALVLTLAIAASSIAPLAHTSPQSAQSSAPKKSTALELISLANAHDPSLASAISATFDAKDLKAGTAQAGHGPDFFFAIDAASQPTLRIDDKPGPAMQNIAGSSIWYVVARVEPVSKLHSFDYLINGEKFGGSVNLPALGPLSYLQSGAPSGKLSDKITHISKIYDGMKSDYWIYVPAQYDPNTPAALMVFQDGEWYTDREGENPALNVIDNLIAQKKIPVMIVVFIKPGSVVDAPGTPTYTFVKGYSEKWQRTLDDSMRSTLYDTVSDRYPRFLRDEILADVAAKYTIRKDGYSHAITGLSSGAICSFNAAWQMPDLFTRVISWIGSYSSIQWKEDPSNSDGGQDYPDKMLREPHRNIRVWLEDGTNDLENPHYGSWALNNIRMANALKMHDYDFHFSFGTGSHSAAHGATEFPEEMIWLWRGYDPAKTSDTFTIDPAEKALPQFRVSINNRTAE